jgi:predicted RNase H-like nuclease (RuvC/YqgF family)
MNLDNKSKPKPQKTTQQSIDPEIYHQINELSRRLRVAEENYTGMRRKSQLTDQNMLSTNKELKTEIKTINSDIHDLKLELKDINEKIDQMAKEMPLFAKRNDVKVIQKYVQLLDPMRFATINQVKEIVKEELNNQKE